ncbi:MAG TPA: glycosyl hydrolase family 18 protein [Clostridia bacterium]|nr:glycosyl hydrolase family 18 protein [Clostridia bacterium]
MVKSRIYIINVLMLAFIFVTTAVPVYGAKKTNSPPTATNVLISGTPVVGQTLTGNYKYNNSSGIAEGASTYKWLYSTSLSGTYYAISGATSRTYTLTGSDTGRYIKFQVTPVASRGTPNTGTPVQSPAVGPVTAPVSGTAPIASNVSIDGNLVVNQALMGKYSYYDAEADAEGSSVYRWLSSTSLTGTYTAIIGATASTYTLTSADSGKYIKFEVTPVSSAGTPNTGAAVQSLAAGPVVLPASTKVVLGFAVKYYSTDVSSYNSMVNNTKSIDQIATVTYTADSYGTLTGTAPSDQISYANNNGIKPLALVTNSDSSGFNSSIARSILEKPTNSQTLINNLVNVVKSNGYKGVNVDFENVPYTDRSYYTQFISNLKNALAPLGYLTTISVPAKTADSPTNSWNGAFDYSALGALVDEILLMTYDEHGSWSAAGPVASIGWVTNVVNYAKTVIPSNKLLLGLAAYGYDWSSAGNKALSLKTIDSLVATYGGAVQWDSTSQSPYYTYTDTNGAAHTIWFENSASIGYKCDLVNQNNLLGTGIWRLGLENQAFWGAINTKFGK